jgi:hypothetical protein
MGAGNEQSVTNWQALACDEDLPQNDSPLLFKGKEGSLGLTLSWKYGWGPPSLYSGSRAKPQVNKTTKEASRAFHSRYLEPAKAIGYFQNHPQEASRNIHHQRCSSGATHPHNQPIIGDIQLYACTAGHTTPAL